LSASEIRECASNGFRLNPDIASLDPGYDAELMQHVEDPRSPD
jgi:hypothetical protein